MAITAQEQEVELRDAALSALDKVNQIAINDDEDYETSAAFLKYLRDMKKGAEDYWKPKVKAAHAARKTIKDAENEQVKPVKEAISTMSQKMGGYQQECQRQRIEEEKMARQLAEDEARAANEELAQGLEESGSDEAAEGVRSTQDMVARLASSAVKVESHAPKVQGTSVRTTWKFRIVDANLVPRDYLIPDEKTIGAVVRARKEATSIPGVEAYPDTKVH